MRTAGSPEFLAWWIDQETGLPIPERAGVLHYYMRLSERIIWADRPGRLDATDDATAGSSA
jgi:hypothetical protein